MLTNRLRIIGGKWRSRKISFPPIAGLRPTPDRVRETLFNWLMPVIEGAHCLDPFAGSGALSLEALSRGAAHVIMLDQSAQVIAHLSHIIQALDAFEHATLYHANALTFLPSLKQPFDIVFLDPPFYKSYAHICCTLLQQFALVKPKSYIYLETEKGLSPLPIPKQWQIVRYKQAGQVAYHLLQVIDA